MFVNTAFKRKTCPEETVWKRSNMDILAWRMTLPPIREDPGTLEVLML